MELDFNSEKPIFQQIAEGLEDSILSGASRRKARSPPSQSFPCCIRSTPPQPSRASTCW